MVRKNPISKMAYSATEALSPKYLKYYKGRIITKIGYCKFYMDTDPEIGLLYFWYKNNISLNCTNANHSGFKLSLDLGECRFGVDCGEPDGDKFYMERQLLLDDKITTSDLQPVILDFSRRLNHTIDMAYANGLPVVCHI